MTDHNNLVGGAQRGDPTAFHEIVRPFERRTQGRLRALIRERNDVDDVGGRCLDVPEASSEERLGRQQEVIAPSGRRLGDEAWTMQDADYCILCVSRIPRMDIPA
jgi:hypothetical protein